MSSILRLILSGGRDEAGLAEFGGLKGESIHPAWPNKGQTMFKGNTEKNRVEMAMSILFAPLDLGVPAWY